MSWWPTNNSRVISSTGDPRYDRPLNTSNKHENMEGLCSDGDLIYAFIRFTDPPIPNTIEHRGEILKNFRKAGFTKTQSSDDNFDRILDRMIEKKNRDWYQENPPRLPTISRPTIIRPTVPNKYVIPPQIYRPRGGRISKRIKNRRTTRGKKRRNNKKTLRRRRISK